MKGNIFHIVFLSLESIKTWVLDYLSGFNLLLGQHIFSKILLMFDKFNII